jgi:hypothetical protein
MLLSRRLQTRFSIFETRTNLYQESWARQEAAGMYNSAQYAEIKDKVECMNGTAVAGPDVFQCNNVSSYASTRRFHLLTHLDRLTCFISCLIPSSVALAVSDLRHGVSIQRSAYRVHR